MKRAIALACVAALAAVAATAALAKPSATQSAAAAQALSCKSQLKIAMVTPLTGGAGFLGNEQLSWAKYAVKTLAPKLGLKIQLLTGDTPVEQGAAVAQSLAQKYVADSRVVGIIGPSTSGAVAASSQTYFDAGIAHISPSATRTSLTKGEKREATPAFFRVVPGDYIQGPSDARFMIEKLKVKKVVILDFQEPYSVGLADAVEQTLKKGDVSTSRLSVPNTVTDFSSYVTRVPSDADIVFFPTQKPADAQTFAQQLVEQGKRAKVFGGDGSNDPDKFKFAGSYVSNFAPDISGIAADKDIIAGWRKDNPGATLGSFGPPTYGAVEVLLNAIKAVCVKDKGQIKDRREIIGAVKRVRIKNWILGGSFRFSTKSNDPLNAKFYIFQIQPNGSYKLVG
ncbi:MAG TPA: branched-chain amino acid ABC transporter substrate-binding protein [Vicinamibacterales bacterium]|nr:branched-chain amino acid ABC transporter substrate-binding protein [Vicinamibacterales bacterium]